ncbi:hypothetical protein QAD02_004561, partial [Eretmocerus hayati]
WSDDVRRRVRKSQLLIQAVVDVRSRLEELFGRSNSVDFVRAGPSSRRTGSGAGDQSATGGYRELTHYDECEAGPSSGSSNARASQSASNSVGSASRCKLEKELYELHRDLKEMRQEMDLSWPLHLDRASLSSDNDEIHLLERRLGELESIQDTLQQVLIYMSEEFFMSKGLIE